MIFAAGLILGFSIFAEGEVRHGVEEAFTSTRTVLQVLAGQSPQAELYYDILTEMSDAITKYRQQLASERRRSTGQYVTQIFTIKTAPASSTQIMSPLSPDADTLAASDVEPEILGNATELELEWDQMDFGLGLNLGIWDNLDLRLLEDIPNSVE